MGLKSVGVGGSPPPRLEEEARFLQKFDESQSDFRAHFQDLKKRLTHLWEYL